MPNHQWVALDLFTGEIVDPDPPAPKFRRTNPIFEALAEICGLLPERDAETNKYNWLALTDAEIGQLNRYSGQLKRAGATHDRVIEFGKWFVAHDWRGQRGQKPKPADVATSWTFFINAMREEDHKWDADRIRYLESRERREILQTWEKAKRS